MKRIKTLQELFQRYRRPGDFTYAFFSLALSLFLLWQLPSETVWMKRTKLFAQPSFWPTIAIVSMVIFSALHLLGAFVSERLPGRWQEVAYWIKSIEFILWFMAYVMISPVIGYLLATILFCNLLSFRMGYRTWRWMLISTIFAIVTVLIFKTFLQVKLPIGQIYEYLPNSLRSFMMINF